MADSYWSTEEGQGFGVLMYPGIDSLQRHFDGLKQIGWPRYIRSKTLLGTPLSPDVEGMLHNFALLEMIGRPRWMRDNPPLSASMLWDQ